MTGPPSSEPELSLPQSPHRLLPCRRTPAPLINTLGCYVGPPGYSRAGSHCKTPSFISPQSPCAVEGDTVTESRPLDLDVFAGCLSNEDGSLEASIQAPEVLAAHLLGPVFSGAEPGSRTVQHVPILTVSNPTTDSEGHLLQI